MGDRTALSVKKKIVWYDNYPILSYLIINGKCRKCKKSIPIQYPLVEFLNILYFIIIIITVQLIDFLIV